MKNISILVPGMAVMQTIADPQQLFTSVNEYLISLGKRPLFTVELVGAKRQVKVNDNCYSIRTNKLLEDVKQTDLILVPALAGDMELAVKKNQVFIPWIVQQYKNGAEVASLCAGAFLLASTGLLDGKKCCTHWAAQNDFKKMFPSVELVESKIITDEKRIYSSGGSNSYWNLLLYLLEKYTNRELAILTSKYFAIDIDRDSQAVFTIFKGQKKHGDKEILKAQEYIEKRVYEKFTVEQLAAITGLGLRTFQRRFKQATHNPVLEYIHRVKIEAAKRQFEASRKNVNEVMYDLGYVDTRSFRNLFIKITGVSPVEYRAKYSNSGKSGK